MEINVGTNFSDQKVLLYQLVLSKIGSVQNWILRQKAPATADLEPWSIFPPSGLVTFSIAESIGNNGRAVGSCAVNERCNTSLHGSHLIFSENAHRDLPEKRLAHRYHECSKVSDTSSAVAKDRQATSDAHLDRLLGGTHRTNGLGGHRWEFCLVQKNCSSQCDLVHLQAQRVGE